LFRALRSRTNCCIILELYERYTPLAQRRGPDVVQADGGWALI
jgi:hypothetical protein